MFFGRSLEFSDNTSRRLSSAGSAFQKNTSTYCSPSAVTACVGSIVGRTNCIHFRTSGQTVSHREYSTITAKQFCREILSAFETTLTLLMLGLVKCTPPISLTLLFCIDFPSMLIVNIWGSSILVNVFRNSVFLGSSCNARIVRNSPVLS